MRRLFTAFEQVHADPRLRAGGTGLGLVICREFAALMAGRIEVSSEPGRGSVFRLVVPLDAVAEKSNTPVSKAIVVRLERIPS